MMEILAVVDKSPTSKYNLGEWRKRKIMEDKREALPLSWFCPHCLYT